MAINSIPEKTNISLPTTPNAKKDTVVNTHPQPADNIQEKSDFTAVAQEIRNALDSTAVVDEQKIEAIKASLNKGNYQIDADKIAEKMLQFNPNHLNST